MNQSASDHAESYDDCLTAAQGAAIGRDPMTAPIDQPPMQDADRHALAAIIALTYKMQPHSMLNPEVPLMMADAILAWLTLEGFQRWTPKRACGWKENEDGQYETTCGHCWEFNNGGPAENKVTFCPYCGKAISVRAARAAEEGEK